MCKFFSLITLKGEYYYFDWKQRQERNFDDCDSHSEIAKFYDLKDDAVNFYEYNPLTKKLVIDAKHGPDDSKAVQEWCDKLDWKTIVEPLIVKQIANPFELPKVDKPTDEQIEWLKQWVSVWNSVWNSVGDSVWNSVWNSVGASVRNSVWSSVRDSVWSSVHCYASSFFDIEYEHDFSPCVKLWEAGLVPSYDGETWRLHRGKNADIVFEWKPNKSKGN